MMQSQQKGGPCGAVRTKTYGIQQLDITSLALLAPCELSPSSAHTWRKSPQRTPGGRPEECSLGGSCRSACFPQGRRSCRPGLCGAVARRARLPAPAALGPSQRAQRPAPPWPPCQRPPCLSAVPAACAHIISATRTAKQERVTLC